MAKFIGQPKPSKAVARCVNYKHSGLLSLRNMKNHRCEEKQCPFFIPLKDHQYWLDKERKKADKKYRKQMQIIEKTIKYADAETIAETIAGLVWNDE